MSNIQDGPASHCWLHSLSVSVLLTSVLSVRTLVTGFLDANYFTLKSQGICLESTCTAAVEAVRLARVRLSAIGLWVLLRRRRVVALVVVRSHKGAAYSMMLSITDAKSRRRESLAPLIRGRIFRNSAEALAAFLAA